MLSVMRERLGDYLFCDCSAESPKGRRSVCYDREGLDSRKKHEPENNAIEMAAAMGIAILMEEQYRELQKLGDFDTKTSSWVKTPSDVRELGGALFVIDAMAVFSCITMVHSHTTRLGDSVAQYASEYGPGSRSTAHHSQPRTAAGAQAREGVSGRRSLGASKPCRRKNSSRWARTRHSLSAVRCEWAP